MTLKYLLNKLIPSNFLINFKSKNAPDNEMKNLTRSEVKLVPGGISSWVTEVMIEGTLLTTVVVGFCMWAFNTDPPFPNNVSSLTPKDAYKKGFSDGLGVANFIGEK